MKVVLQRVSSAKVEISNAIKGEIGLGYLILLGIAAEDNQEDINWLVNKILNLRVFNDDQNKMNLSIKYINGEILLISQFTLFASTKKGNRPSFTKSMHPDQAIPLYNKFIEILEYSFKKSIQTGVFGADMQITLTNDGPVTINLDSKDKV